MLGITYHNPATITVYLDRMRFRDCFVSSDDMQDGSWKTKLKNFVEVPTDGRDRIVFVESFSALQTLLKSDADFHSVKVAVYDECEVLSKVPGAHIVDAKINGDDQDTWQLYTVSFKEFNDALAAQPSGVPGLLRDHEIKEDADLPEEPKPAPTKVETVSDEDEDVKEDADDTKETSASHLVMEQILDDIESEDEDETPEREYQEPGRVPDPAITLGPKPASKVVVEKRTPEDCSRASPSDQIATEEHPESDRIDTEEPAVMQEETEQAPAPDTLVAPSLSPSAPEPCTPEPKSATEKPKKRKARKKPKLKSYELF